MQKSGFETSGAKGPAPSLGSEKKGFVETNLGQVAIRADLLPKSQVHLVAAMGRILLARKSLGAQETEHLRGHLVAETASGPRRNCRVLNPPGCLEGASLNAFGWEFSG